MSKSFDRLLSAAREMRASIAPDANGWMPIETAPKDGSYIDLWARREGTESYERITDCAWENMTDWYGHEREGWSGLHPSFHRSYTYPTHWRPLPSPPITNSLSSTPPAMTKPAGSQPPQPAGTPSKGAA